MGTRLVRSHRRATLVQIAEKVNAVADGCISLSLSLILCLSAFLLLFQHGFITLLFSLLLSICFSYLIFSLALISSFRVLPSPFSLPLTSSALIASPIFVSLLSPILLVPDRSRCSGNPTLMKMKQPSVCSCGGVCVCMCEKCSELPLN